MFENYYRQQVFYIGFNTKLKISAWCASWPIKDSWNGYHTVQEDDSISINLGSKVVPGESKIGFSGDIENI